MELKETLCVDEVGYRTCRGVEKVRSVTFGGYGGEGVGFWRGE